MNLAQQQNEWTMQRFMAGDRDAPLRDPANVAHSERLSLSPHTMVLYGCVLDGVAFHHFYRVAFENGRIVLPCTMLTATALLPWGPKQLNTLPPGCPVWVIWHPQMLTGYIIGVAPRFHADPRKIRADFIHQAGRCGIGVDAHQNGPLHLPGNGGITNHAMGRALDLTSGGEWGAMTELGLRIVLDPAMAQVAVDEATGLFVHYHDHFVRLAGINMQQFSAGHQFDAIRDEAEFILIHGSTPFPKEQVGCLQDALPAFREISARDMQIDKPELGGFEPVHTDQAAFHRTVDYGGYLGQGFLRIVQAPPADATYNRLTDDSLKYVGVYAHHVGLNGAVLTQTVHSHTIVKKIFIPAPKMKRLPADTEGDNESNYRFAGRTGSGPEHKVKGQVEVADGTTAPSPLRAAAFLDHLAYSANWEALHPFHYHRKDWALPEEEDLPINSTEQAPIDFAGLSTRQYLDPPAMIPIPGDTRGQAKAFPNLSYFSLLPDGGVVIGGGCGEEIKMAGGSITISCPGDIWFQPGRNVNMWPGYDLIGKAGNSIDLSAGRGDLRLKAEKNMQLLAGNGGVGGILLESKAESDNSAFKDKVGEDVESSGILIKSRHSVFKCYTAGVYMRTGGGDVDPGPIVFDAAKGQDAIYARASGVYRYLQNASADYFGNGPTTEAVFVVGPSGALLNGNLGHNGGAIVVGPIACGAGIVALGHFASPAGGDVGKLTSAGAVSSAIIQMIKAHRNAQRSADDTFQALFQDFFYAADRPGNDDTIEAASFTFRNETQMKIPDDFILDETRWQQLARITGQEPGKWEEKSVTVGSTEMYPYPGKKFWADESAYREIDLKLYDAEHGYSKSRSENQADYEDPILNEPTLKSIKDGYLVIA